jgi:DnaJ-class molecular chaperone
MVPDKEEVSYYELLNVPKDASQDEIKKAYYRYSTVLHPDKQKDDDLREEASSYFVQIKEAHEVRHD